MRHYLLLLALLLTASITSRAAEQAPLSGRVVDSNSMPISYATVVVSHNGEQVAGTATDDMGTFAITLTKGNYSLIVSFIGYKEYRAEINGTETLGDITLEQESTEIESVEVRSNFIRREADRFVVDVANSPSAIGQDGEELLRGAPGVWVDNEKISINGTENPKIFVNDRELKLSSEQILIYIRNLKSEDVRRIEVIPLTGAEQDANSASGAIKIYLKRQLEAGMVGNVSTRGMHSKYMSNLSPSASINYQGKRLTLNTNGWYNIDNSSTSILSNSDYTWGAKLHDTNTITGKSTRLGGRLEAIYDFNSKHSIGAELSLYDSNENNGSEFNSDILQGDVHRLTDGENSATSSGNHLSAAFNYIYRIDSLGSTLKLLADHNRNSSDSFTDSRSTVNSLDSLYRANTGADYKVSTISLAYERILCPTLSIKAGAKYTNNDMDSRSTYTHLKNDKWQTLLGYNNDAIYTENISAAYVSATSRLGRWGVVAGLRSEYTSTKGDDGALDKDYLSLFPNVNLSYSLNDMSSNSIILQYARSIKRPNFWYLNPSRTQISEYSYQIGNPALKAEYSNSVNLSYIYKYKYSLTAGLSIAQNGTQQVVIQDQVNPEISYIKPINMDNQASYYITANLPFQFTDWWNLSANITYMYRGEKMYNSNNTFYQNMTFLYAQTTFTLPLNFYITGSCYGMSDVYSGNIFVEGQTMASIAIKKQFAKKRFTASIMANSLFGRNQRMTSTTDVMKQCIETTQGWGLPCVGFSLSYNFKAGKEYQQRAGVESASGNDAARMTAESKENQIPK